VQQKLNSTFNFYLSTFNSVCSGTPPRAAAAAKHVQNKLHLGSPHEPPHFKSPNLKIRLSFYKNPDPCLIFDTSGHGLIMSYSFIIMFIYQEFIIMIKSGSTFTVQETGETFTFLKTAADTNGKLLQVYLHIAPGGGAKGAPIHIHPLQEERFFIKRGHITFDYNGEKITRGPGERVIVPAGVPHTFRNETDEKAEFIVEIEPALHMETLFETMGALSHQGKVGRNGGVNPLRIAVMLDKYRDHMYMAGVPVFLQKFGFIMLGFVGRLLGMKPELSYFDSGDAKTLPQAARP
jgi:quercetin dioxygenase-like cupin family protein